MKILMRLTNYLVMGLANSRSRVRIIMKESGMISKYRRIWLERWNRIVRTSMIIGIMSRLIKMSGCKSRYSFRLI